MPASRHVTWKSLMRLLPLAPKLQARIRRILSQILNFGFPQKINWWHPNFWTYPIKFHLVRIVWQSLVAIGLGGSEILPLNHLPPPPFFLGGGTRGRPPNKRPPKSKCPYFQSYVKVSGRSPQPSRRYSTTKCHKKERKKKPQQNISPPGTTVPGGLIKLIVLQIWLLKNAKFQSKDLLFPTSGIAEQH